MTLRKIYLLEYCVRHFWLSVIKICNMNYCWMIIFPLCYQKSQDSSFPLFLDTLWLKDMRFKFDIIYIYCSKLLMYYILSYHQTKDRGATKYSVLPGQYVDLTIKSEVERSFFSLTTRERVGEFYSDMYLYLWWWWLS